MKSVSELIGKMMGENMLRINERWVWSWGNRAYCDQLFRYIFREVDRTYDLYEHLPEYDEVIDWMTNTDDKGLMLMGDCGRGKSVILNGVLPVLFRMKNRVLQPVHAQNFSAEVPNQRLAWGERPATYLDRLLTNGYPAIDELGIEPMMNDYGEKSEGFNQVLNAAERYHRPVFVTTNLTEVQILDRYGERTMDRLAHLCRTIHFEGESLRK